MPKTSGSFLAAVVLALLGGSQTIRADAPEKPQIPDGIVSSRSFVDSSQIVSKYTTEQYAHQCSLKIVGGIGYAAYQCNETSPAENVAGQKIRMAVFNILNPTATATWVDISASGDSSNGITVGGTFVESPMLHVVDEKTLRVFFVTRQSGDPVAIFRVLYKDYSIADGRLSELHQAQCTIANKPDEKCDLTMPNVQKHLDYLFGEGFGAQFARGISTACDMVEIDGQLYSAVQIKNSSGGKTLLMTNVLMRSSDNGATWTLLGAPDPRLLAGKLPDDVKILAEPALSFDRKNIYLHLRSNVVENGYVLSKASRENLYSFDAPVKKWTYGIGRPAVCDFGKPIGMVGLFTAPSVQMGGTTVTRNKLDIVLIDPKYSAYSRAFSIVDYDAVNTPFACKYNDEVYVAYSTGRRRLVPRFGTSEIVFTKLRREFFVPGN